MIIFLDLSFCLVLSLNFLFCLRDFFCFEFKPTDFLFLSDLEFFRLRLAVGSLILIFFFLSFLLFVLVFN